MQWQINVQLVRSKLEAWAERASDVRLVHVDAAGREMELEQYKLEKGTEAKLAETVARDLEIDVATYASPQRYHLIARLADGVLLGLARFQLEGKLHVPHGGQPLPPPTESGLVGQLMGHLESKEQTIKSLVSTVKETVTAGMESMRSMLEVYKREEAGIVKARLEMRHEEVAARVVEIRELEEQTRKNAIHGDAREGFKFLLHKVFAGDAQMTTSTVDRLVNSITKEQLQTLMGSFSEEQMRDLVTLKEGTAQRAKKEQDVLSNLVPHGANGANGGASS